jgi:soluble lytic murein transglycosylase-like protein
MDASFAKSRRRAESRRARLRRPKLRRKLRRPVLALILVVAASLGAVGGPRSFAGAQRLVRGSKPAAAASCPVPASLRPAFESAARATGLPIALLTAVGSVESRLDQNARSEVGAIGVLQLMPATAAELKLDPLRSETNVLAGARYLKLMLDRYHSTDLALAAYNAGPTAVDRAGGAPGAQTQTYVSNVQSRWRTLAGCR